MIDCSLRCRADSTSSPSSTKWTGFFANTARAETELLPSLSDYPRCGAAAQERRCHRLVSSGPRCSCEASFGRNVSGSRPALPPSALESLCDGRLRCRPEVFTICDGSSSAAGVLCRKRGVVETDLYALRIDRNGRWGDRSACGMLECDACDQLGLRIKDLWDQRAVSDDAEGEIGVTEQRLVNDSQRRGRINPTELEPA